MKARQEAKAESLWITRFSRERERQFFFYFTLIMAAIWALMEVV